MSPHDWQDALWSIPNHLGVWGWKVPLGVIAIVSAVAAFMKLIMGHRFDLLLSGRILINVGLADFFFRILNSGWTEWGIALVTLGCAITTFAILTDWCLKTAEQKCDWLKRFAPPLHWLAHRLNVYPVNAITPARRPP